MNESMCWVSIDSDVMINDNNDDESSCTQSSMRSNESIWTCDLTNNKKNNEDNNNV